MHPFRIRSQLLQERWWCTKWNHWPDSIRLKKIILFICDMKIVPVTHTNHKTFHEALIPINQMYAKYTPNRRNSVSKDKLFHAVTLPQIWTWRSPAKCLEVMNEAIDWCDRDTNSHFTVLGSHQEAGMEGRDYYAIYFCLYSLLHIYGEGGDFTIQ